MPGGLTLTCSALKQCRFLADATSVKLASVIQRISPAPVIGDGFNKSAIIAIHPVGHWHCEQTSKVPAGRCPAGKWLRAVAMPAVPT
jgi:hypothetical protein